MPRYKGSAGPTKPEERSTVGVLVTNLGTPDEPSSGALRRYLGEFLWDPRVVELARPLWWVILHLFILPLRPLKVSRLYRSIWTAEGSPLLVFTRRLAQRIDVELDGAFPIAVGMRYGQPSIERAMDQLIDRGCGRIVHLPLYPQYSASTTATNVDAVSAAAAGYRWVPNVRHVAGYHVHRRYIEALAASVRRVREKDAGETRHLLMSFHGIPQRYADQGDPYPAYCRQTADALAAELGLDDEDWTLTFQSRFGREPWLQPYTDRTLETMAHQGIHALDVICPGFAVDCLETLEEIEEQNRKIFMDAGGKDFRYVPALNDSDDHAALGAALVREQLVGWTSEKGGNG